MFKRHFFIIFAGLVLFSNVHSSCFERLSLVANHMKNIKPMMLGQYRYSFESVALNPETQGLEILIKVGDSDDLERVSKEILLNQVHYRKVEIRPDNLKSIQKTEGKKGFYLNIQMNRDGFILDYQPDGPNRFLLTRLIPTLLPPIMAKKVSISKISTAVASKVGSGDLQRAARDIQEQIKFCGMKKNCLPEINLPFPNREMRDLVYDELSAILQSTR